MKRNILQINNGPFDVVVVGGGIFGAAALREAALSGLSAVLLEQNDFSHATSANHFKMVHCGIRYLQHLDIKRLWESSYERSALLRIAPHLVQNLPIVIPTYGMGLQGKLFLGAGMYLYDLLTLNRNKGLLPEKKIAASRIFSKVETLDLFPHLPAEGLSGGMVFEDGQMYNLPRLALSFIRSAVEKGALAVNHAKVTGIIKEGDTVAGVNGVDQISGEPFKIKARMVLNTAGPWAHRLPNWDSSVSVTPPPTFSRDLAFTVPRRFDHPYGVALPSETKDTDVLLDRGGRHLFAVPWRNATLVGVWHKVFAGPPEQITVTEEELNQCQQEISRAYPGLCDSADHIKVINTGLTLFGDAGKQKEGGLSFGKRSMLIDHQNVEGINGLVTLIGVRATTGRRMAHRAIKLIAGKLGKPSVSEEESVQEPLWGGDFSSLDKLRTSSQANNAFGLNQSEADALIRNCGSRFVDVLKYATGNGEKPHTLPGSTTLRAEVIHSVREEMAMTLKDVVFRRTDLGTSGNPGIEALTECANLMAGELDWSEERVQEEIDGVINNYPRLG